MNKVSNFILCVCIYLAVLFFVYFVHINFLTVNVIFYSALFDCAIALLICGLISKLFPRTSSFSKFESFQLLIILFLIGYSISISGPTVIDRSLSFYLLEKIDQYDGSVKLIKMDEILEKEFLKEYRVLDARLTEQQKSGTISIKNGCVSLTNRGYSIVSVSKFIRKNLLAKKRLIGGEYTDDLTNPLSGAVIKPNFKCDFKKTK